MIARYRATDWGVLKDETNSIFMPTNEMPHGIEYRVSI
jgi:hypothetical protein